MSPFFRRTLVICRIVSAGRTGLRAVGILADRPTTTFRPNSSLRREATRTWIAPHELKSHLSA